MYIELEKYFLQYMSIENKGGEKILWINALKDSSEGNWKNEVITVRGGGNAYFQMLINLSKKEVIDFSVQGES